MQTSITIWCAVAAMMVVVILARIFVVLRAKHPSHVKRVLKLKHIISMGSERESIWMPGDRLVSDKYYGDYDDD